MVADGMSTAGILDAYPDLDCNDIQLLKNLPVISAALQEGSIVVFDQLRIRVRPLPVSGND